MVVTAPLARLGQAGPLLKFRCSISRLWRSKPLSLPPDWGKSAASSIGIHLAFTLSAVPKRVAQCGVAGPPPGSRCAAARRARRACARRTGRKDRGTQTVSRIVWSSVRPISASRRRRSSCRKGVRLCAPARCPRRQAWNRLSARTRTAARDHRVGEWCTAVGGAGWSGRVTQLSERVAGPILPSSARTAHLADLVDCGSGPVVSVRRSRS